MKNMKNIIMANINTNLDYKHSKLPAGIFCKTTIMYYKNNFTYNVFFYCKKNLDSIKKIIQKKALWTLEGAERNYKFIPKKISTEM